MIRWRTFRQYPEPTERVVALEYAKHAIGNAGPAYTVEAVTPGDKIATDFLLPALVHESDFGLLPRQVVHAYIAYFKQQRTAVGEPTLDQVLHHLLLAVNRDTLIHEPFEVDAVKITIDSDIDPPMQHAFPLQPFADAKFREKVRSPVLD